MTENKIKNVTVNASMSTANEDARKNMNVIIEFFSLYLGDTDQFYSLWVKDNPAVITPFTTDDVAVLHSAVQEGWDAIKGFFDPIFKDMKGTFEWTIDEFIIGENPNTIVTKTRSNIDILANGPWGKGKKIKYNGIYVQIFKFENNKIKSFEEYYDTALLNKQYS
ncbi:SnoaL-like domain protein [compost metagenome]